MIQQNKKITWHVCLLVASIFYIYVLLLFNLSLQLLNLLVQ